MSEEIIKVNINEKKVTETISDDATLFVSDGGMLLRIPVSSVFGNMQWCDEVPALPDTAKVGDVYKLSSTIYRNGAYYIPVSMGDVGEIDGITRQYIDSVHAEDICDMISEMVSDGRINDFALENDEVKLELPLVGAGYDNGHYIDTAFDTIDYVNYTFNHILVPDEYGEKYFPGRKVVLYHKGDMVVFGKNGWERADADELANIRYDIEDYKREVDERFYEVGGDYADVTLENVSNEDFKAKAEAAGVGDDAGEHCYMDFKGVVNALPETASEGKVYTISNEIWEKKKTLETFENGLNFEDTCISSWSFNGWNNESAAVEEVISENGGVPVKIKFADSINNEVVFEVQTEAVCKGESPTEIYFYGEKISGGTSINTPCDLYAVKYDNHSYIRHNGKWVEL